jgi:hypothetical protein
MLMGFHNTAINKCPFQIWFHNQLMKDAHQFFLKRQGIESLLHSIPLSKRCRQVSPRTADSQAIKNTFYLLPKRGFVVNPHAQHNGFELIPVFIRKHLSRHSLLVF